MSITLELPNDLAQELSAEAQRFGLSVTAYVLEIIAGRQASNHMPCTAAEVIDYWRSEQLIGARPEIVDSQLHARRLRNEAETRMR